MEYQGYLFTKIRFADCDVIVPFACERCGWCCEHYIPHLLPREIIRIAADEHWDEDVTLRRYLEEYDEKLHGHAGPCPFLKGDHLCAIHDHALRPEICRLYPFSFRSSDERCPSFHDHRRIVGALTTDAGPFELYDSSFCPDLRIRPVPDQAWPEIWKRFLRAAPPSEVTLQFLAFHGRLQPEKWSLMIPPEDSQQSCTAP